MTTYVALLRGIMPMNPNMRGEKLRGAFEAIGFENVRTVIASGNVVFESPSTDARALEAKIEKALPELLGFNSTTIVRSHEELQAIADKNPFEGIEDNPAFYPVATFFQGPAKGAPREIFTPIKRERMGTTDFMRDFEKKHGKKITTRTWKTVHRILKKMRE